MTDLRTHSLYSHVVSLGSFCGPALELERYGLRDASYPFDWVVCSIEPVVRLLESGFDGFLLLDRLERDPENPRIVHDTGSGVDFYHDFDPGRPLEEQYNSVCVKYERRIARLQTSARKPTLFVRYIADIAEYSYLDQHMAHVLQVLRRLHPDNDLMLIANIGVPSVCGGIEVYLVERDEGDLVARKFARRNRMLRARLLTVGYPPVRRLRNIARYAWRRPIRIRIGAAKAWLSKRLGRATDSWVGKTGA